MTNDTTKCAYVLSVASTACLWDGNHYTGGILLAISVVLFVLSEGFGVDL